MEGIGHRPFLNTRSWLVRYLSRLKKCHYLPLNEISPSSIVAAFFLPPLLSLSFYFLLCNFHLLGTTAQKPDDNFTWICLILLEFPVLRVKDLRFLGRLHKSWPTFHRGENWISFLINNVVLPKLECLRTVSSTAFYLLGKGKSWIYKNLLFWQNINI